MAILLPIRFLIITVTTPHPSVEDFCVLKDQSPGLANIEMQTIAKIAVGADDAGWLSRPCSTNCQPVHFRKEGWDIRFAASLRRRQSSHPCRQGALGGAVASMRDCPGTPFRLQVRVHWRRSGCAAHIRGHDWLHQLARRGPATAPQRQPEARPAPGCPSCDDPADAKVWAQWADIAARKRVPG